MTRSETSLAESRAKWQGLSVTAAAWLAVFCLFGYRATFAVLKDHLSLDMGWNQAQVSLGYSIMMVVYAMTAYFSGLFLDRWGTRPVYLVAAVTGGLGFFVTSFAGSLLHYLLSFGILAGIATGMLWVTSTVSVRKWYSGRSYASMWGIAFSGAPLAQFLLSHITRSILQSTPGGDGWRMAMRVLGLVIGGLLTVAVLLSKRAPEWYGVRPLGLQVPKKVRPSPRPSGGAGKQGEGAALGDGAGLEPEEEVWTLSQAFSRYAIWGVILTFLAAMMAEFLIWTQLVSFWTSDGGWGLDRAVGVYSLIGIAGMVAMPLMGVTADWLVGRLGDEARARRFILILGPAIGAGACLLLLWPGAPMLPAIGAAVLFAFYWAVVPGGVVGYTGAIYGRKSLGAIWGLATLIVMGIGPFAGSFIGGWLADFSGSYLYSICYAFGSFILASIFATSLPLKMDYFHTKK